MKNSSSQIDALYEGNGECNYRLAALSLFEHRLLVLWLPPYCPELNLIERYWKHLKELACVNKLHDSMEDVLASTEYMLTQQNDPTSIFRMSFSKLL